jgi:hypothetical protein
MTHHYLEPLFTPKSIRLNLKRLGAFGVLPEHLPKLVANARGNSMLTNPLVLTDAEIGGIVAARL